MYVIIWFWDNLVNALDTVWEPWDLRFSRLWLRPTIFLDLTPCTAVDYVKILKIVSLKCRETSNRLHSLTFMNIMLSKLGNFSIAYSYGVFSIYSIVPKSVRLRRKCIGLEMRFVSPYFVHPRHFSLRYYLHAFTELFNVIFNENTFRSTVSAVTNSFGLDIFEHSIA
jgi:hypothetical protein